MTAAVTSRWRGFGISDVGRKRERNEDAFYVSDSLGLYVVADGMGGHAAGEVASREAVNAVVGMIKQGLSDLRKLVAPLVEEDAASACRLMESAVQAATYQIFSMSEADPSQSGMGTTLSALLMVGSYAVMGHVGDSRIYRVRRGSAEVITEDHTLIAWQLKQGFITPQAARTSPHRSMVLRGIGFHDHVEVDTGLISLEPGDRFLLCTDGLYNYMRRDDIQATLLLDAQLAAERFVDLANERGGSDNITAVIVELH